MLNTMCYQLQRSRPQTTDVRWISERSRIEVKTQKFLKDKINRLKQPDARISMDVLVCGRLHRSLVGQELPPNEERYHSATRPRRGPLSHEACNSPLELYTSRSVSIEAIVPRSADHEIRVLLDLTQPTMTMTQTFEYRLREALKKSAHIAASPKMMRALNTRVKDDADVRLFTTTRNTS
jgi:hypothetical protein